MNLNPDNIKLLVILATEPTHHKILTRAEPDENVKKNTTKVLESAVNISDTFHRSIRFDELLQKIFTLLESDIPITTITKTNALNGVFQDN